MAVLGKTGLYGAALYLGILFAIYGQKNVSFKDSKEVDAIARIVMRKGKPSKDAIRGIRTQRLKQVLASDDKRYRELIGDDNKGKASAFRTEYQKKEWLR